MTLTRKTKRTPQENKRKTFIFTGKLLKHTGFKRKKIYGKPKFLKERAVGAFNIYGARQTAKTLNIYGTPTLLIYTEVF